MPIIQDLAAESRNHSFHTSLDFRKCLPEHSHPIKIFKQAVLVQNKINIGGSLAHIDLNSPRLRAGQDPSRKVSGAHRHLIDLDTHSEALVEGLQNGWH